MLVAPSLMTPYRDVDCERAMEPLQKLCRHRLSTERLTIRCWAILRLNGRFRGPAWWDVLLVLRSSRQSAVSASWKS